MGDNYNNDYIEPAIDIADKYEDIMLENKPINYFINESYENSIRWTN